MANSVHGPEVESAFASARRPARRTIRVDGHDVEIAEDLVFNAGALHLDDDLLPAEQRGLMHLADGRGGERLIIKLREQLVGGFAELELD